MTGRLTAGTRVGTMRRKEPIERLPVGAALFIGRVSRSGAGNGDERRKGYSETG
jgi:hypothetical protein